MTIQFKKFIIGLASLFLGGGLFYLLILFTVPKNAELMVLWFGFVYLCVAIGSVPIFYILLKKWLLPTVAISQALPQEPDKWKLIVLGVAMGIILPMVYGVFFDVASKGNRSFVFSTWSLLPTVATPVGFLGFFFFPYFLTRPVKIGRKILICLIYAAVPVLIIGLIGLL